MNPVFLRARWQHLAMMNYEADPGLFSPFIPRGTEIDSWHGKTYLSVVGFLFLRTRVYGIPVPFHINFEEVNLRFYVRRRSGEEVRRGVVFIKELVPRFAIAATARLFYNENYAAVPMGHRLAYSSNHQEGLREAEYSWKYRGVRHRMVLSDLAPSKPMEAGSREEFIAEHYWGYAAQKDGSTVEYRVDHPRWNIQTAGTALLEGPVDRLYGPQFGDVLSRPPAFSFVADGSDVVVRKGTRSS